MSVYGRVCVCSCTRQRVRVCVHKTESGPVCLDILMNETGRVYVYVSSLAGCKSECVQEQVSE